MADNKDVILSFCEKSNYVRKFDKKLWNLLIDNSLIDTFML